MTNSVSLSVYNGIKANKKENENMGKLLKNIKDIGLTGAISNVVVTNYYDTKSKYAIASREIKSNLRSRKNSYSDEDEDETSPEFARALGFDSVEECDAFFEALDEDEMTDE